MISFSSSSSISRYISLANILSNIRSFSTLNSYLFASELSQQVIARQKQSKSNKEQIAKRKQQRFIRRRLRARLSPSLSPFYMKIPQALRFLRAAEVGRSPTEGTISVNCDIVMDKSSIPLNSSVKLPHPLKEINIMIFTTKPDQIKLCENLSNIKYIGGLDLIEKIKNNQIDISNIHKSFATSEMATPLTKNLAKILGPKGLLPSVKKNTINDDLSTFLDSSLSSVPFKQKGLSVSVAVGRSNFSDAQVYENVLAFSKAVRDAITQQKAKRPSILAQATISTPRGPGIVIDF
ncbi:mitochondrial 54S ribosomal protein uL1m [Ascoidea rubescens DSM 1968]|uniref:Ribosomal protein L1 n=1 Tax=Ascoidea rubescens DSM 1968 TaxID=1344418 RepID=A0A1D2VQN8_9ASCO|nr:ribosomal protein L1 [Ascoidea rubescens DSM 1968]ODV63898.1 ribosomal protein L1 [Ascoidea rubescens DSM 1968]